MKFWLWLVVWLPGVGGAAGNPAAGREIALDPERGDCIICHRVLLESPQQQGNIGPPLLDVGSRLTREEIRVRVEDARRVNPETLMPPYGSTRNLRQVAREYRGRPMLTPEEIDDLVAWLMTLRGEQ